MFLRCSGAVPRTYNLGVSTLNGAEHQDAGDGGASRAPVTLRTIERMASAGEPFACLTCYDATTARWLDRAGVHVLLVGDTAAEVVLGFPSTIHMPLDIAIALTAAVRRGAPTALVMGDMPFMSYQAGEDEALRNAGRFLTEGGADIVKIEADAAYAPLVVRMAAAGVPVCAHVGSRPQHVKRTGGYAAAGRTPEEADRIVRDARALEDAGACMLLVEAAPPEVAERIVAECGVPLIGIGAGPAPHGQVLVLHDLVGLSRWQPGFAEPVASLGEALQRAGEEWVRRVRERKATSHRFEMKPAGASKRPMNG